MIKKILTIAVVFIGLSVQAQEFKSFQLYLGLGYAIPSGGGGGILFDIEPAYRLNDQIAIGLRLESAVTAREVSGTSASTAALGSYTVNGKYYLSNNKFRPYVGVGFGMFSLAAVSLSSSLLAVAAENKFGFYPRVGFDLGHFNINLDYNIIGASKVDGVDDIKNSYLGIRIGAFIFGGQK